MCLALASAIIALTLGWPALSRNAPERGGAPDPAQLCLSAAAAAARDENVPLDVLVTLALVESSRDKGAGLAPWPWAIHTQGRGHWANTRADALAIAQAALDGGTRNIDLGCFQINYHWHGAEFSSLDAMLDPTSNARYAAQLLRAHHDRLGSWDAAVGAYHSRTPALAATYSARFAKLAKQAQTLLHGIDTDIASQTTPQPPRQIAPQTAGAIALFVSVNARPLTDPHAGRP